jgi:hypothetical protein
MRWLQIRGMHWLDLVVRRRWTGFALGVGGMVLTVSLGTFGFECYHFADWTCFGFEGNGSQTPDPRLTGPTIFYLAIQLLILQSGLVTGPVPPMLEAARFLGPVFAGIAAITTFLSLFANRLASWRLGLLREHVVVCGHGLKGSVVVDDLLERGLPVVIVEQRELGTSADSLHERGALVVTGDATDPAVLNRAGCGRARYIIVLCGDDVANIVVAGHVDQLPPATPGKAPSIYVHLQEPELQSMLQSEAGDRSVERKAWQFFSMYEYEHAARTLLAEYFVFDRETVARRTHPREALVVPGHEPCLALIGDSLLVDSLVENLVVAWEPRWLRRKEQLRLVIIGEQVEERLSRLRGRLPNLDDVFQIEPAHGRFTDLSLDERQRRLIGVTTAFVCYENDAEAVTEALAVYRQTAGQPTRVIVSFNRRFGLAQLVTRSDITTSLAAAEERIFAFLLAEASRLADLLLDDLIGRLAEHVYNDWLEERRKEGATAATNEFLDQTNAAAQAVARRSSRKQAQHMMHKLKLVGCTIHLPIGRSPRRFTFTDDERFRLAILEHDRWNDERLLDGWEVGPKTDRSGQVSKDLVPWDRLSEKSKEYDFETVDKLSRWLAEEGFEIIRKKDADPNGLTARRA